MNFNDFLNIRKMRDVHTIMSAAVSRRDLCYVSENKRFRFYNNFPWDNPWVNPWVNPCVQPLIFLSVYILFNRL